MGEYLYDQCTGKERGVTLERIVIHIVMSRSVTSVGGEVETIY